MTTKIDNTKTVIDADLGTTKTYLQTHLQQLTRSANAAANKHGTDHNITRGYVEEANKVATVIATLKQA